MTADHTPERLSAEEREGLWQTAEQAYPALSAPLYGNRRLLETYVERILAAHLADVEARLAAVEALADEWLAADPDRKTFVVQCGDALRAALHPDPSKLT